MATALGIPLSFFETGQSLHRTHKGGDSSIYGCLQRRYHFTCLWASFQLLPVPVTSESSQKIAEGAPSIPQLYIPKCSLPTSLWPLGPWVRTFSTYLFLPVLSGSRLFTGMKSSLEMSRWDWTDTGISCFRVKSKHHTEDKARGLHLRSHDCPL